MVFNSKYALTAAAALAAGFVACAPASATTLVIGTATGGNYIPFGSSAGYNTYQQVYASSDFSGPITINDIQFYVETGTGSPNTGTVTISLSETSKAVDGLSTNLTQNVGANNETVFKAKLSSIQNGVLNIQLSTPYIYNPAKGNLLLNLVEATPYSGGPSFEFDGTAGGLFSRGYSGQTIPVANDSGLVTGFTYVAAVPEASTWAMLLLGFLGLGVVGYRRAAGRAALA